MEDITADKDAAVSICTCLLKGGFREQWQMKHIFLSFYSQSTTLGAAVQCVQKESLHSRCALHSHATAKYSTKADASHAKQRTICRTRS